MDRALSVSKENKRIFISTAVDFSAAVLLVWRACRQSVVKVHKGRSCQRTLGSMKTVMAEVDAHLRTRLRMNIWKQWKVPKKRQWGLQKLGVDKDSARLTAYYGNHYYKVVKSTCVKRAISKEVLARAGLISCLAYYDVRHALKLCWTAVCRTARTVVWEGRENLLYSIN